MSNKKILVGVVFAVAMLGGAIFLAFRNYQSQVNEMPVSALSEFSNANLDESNYKSANLAQFSISFPNSFTSSEHILSGDEGVSLVLNSEDLDKNLASFTIEKYPVDKVELKSLIEYFNRSKLSQRDIFLGQTKIQAVYFTGAAPSLQGPVQQNVILLSHNGYVYKIQMSYTSEEINDELEEEFKNISSTINFL